MRHLLVILLLAPTAAAFGSGADTWAQLNGPQELPGVRDAAEPTIGIPWNTDSVFYQAYTNTYRIRFDDNGTTWDDVTPPNSLINVDPMLHADPETGRVWAGGLAGPCSIMAFSDDDGETWLPTGNMCSGAQFDHQSIGSGPYAALPASNPAFPHATYYCAQLVYTACATSHDGGVTWLPFTEVLPPCGGLHGHIRVSRVTGTAAVPDGSCGGEAGFGYTTTNGAVWMSRTVAGSQAASSGFDPSLDFGHEEGWLYYGLANAAGAHVALSKDDGVTWETIGGGHGEATTWLDVGALHDPPIVLASFSDVRVGDDDRAAFAFLGVEDRDGDGTAGEFPGPYQCNQEQDALVWHYYIARTFDGGQNWTVQRMTQDPVQVGGIWDRGGGDPCRNLLDFNDMDIDSQGRIYVAFADGCIDACATTPSSESAGYRASYTALLRQMTGRGLFSEFDVEEPPPTTSPTTTDAGEDTPLGPVAVAAVAVAALVSRRR